MTYELQLSLLCAPTYRNELSKGIRDALCQLVGYDASHQYTDYHTGFHYHFIISGLDQKYAGYLKEDLSSLLGHVGFKIELREIVEYGGGFLYDLLKQKSNSQANYILKKVHLNKIPLQVDQKRLREYLAMFGPIKSIFICSDKCKGAYQYGFVSFKYEMDAKKSLLEGRILFDDTWIKIKPAIKQQTHALESEVFRSITQRKKEYLKYWSYPESFFAPLQNQRIFRNIRKNHNVTNLRFFRRSIELSDKDSSRTLSTTRTKKALPCLRESNATEGVANFEME